MDKEAKTRGWFDWWRSRATFIEALEPKANFYEVNVLVWAAFDALAGHWARCLHADLQDGTDRRRLGELLSRLGGADNAFERVSLPALWAFGDGLDPARATPAVCDRLRQLRGRRVPTFIEERQARTLHDDPFAKDLLAEVADIAAHKVRGRMTVRDIVLRARFGEIAYEEMRCAVIHEGQPGPRTHSFDLGTESDAGPTYLSGHFTAPPSLGFSSRYMVKVLRACLDGFEAEALSAKVDPSPTPRGSIVLRLDEEVAPP
jgi:hypothetical protein